jgi:hypothetical protein
MGETTRRDLAHERAVAVMQGIYADVRKTEGLNLADAAEAAGVAPKSFYRWLKTPPKKIDLTAVVAVADYLHDVHGYANFIRRWEDVTGSIK